ncbi:MAG: hypothetical protein Q4G05_05655 [Clostridia bacterium]|nr:hypothetical protein [Clostridia bacterium]
MNNYKNQLEKILEKKRFSPEVKNLLLSMLYKIENSYMDYKSVKVNVISRNDYIEKLFYIIKYGCRMIEIIKKDNEGSLYKDIKIDRDYETIRTYANEKILLYSLFKIDEYKIQLIEENQMWEDALTDFIEVSVPSDMIEILRDFNGWAWEVSSKEIPDYIYNMIYQSLKILIGENSIEIIRKYNLKIIKNILTRKYREKIINKYMENVKNLILAKYKKQEYGQEIKTFQETFLECITYKAMQIKDKDELYKSICEFRYYLMVPFDEKITIGDVEAYNKQLNEIKEILIRKAVQLKLIKEISKNENDNFEILKNLFKTRIINLKKISVEVIYKDDKYYVKYYDSKLLESTFNIKPVKVKLKKRYKIF